MMKTILAATDFSESAQNALDYAAQLAVTLDAKLILFHAFHVPVVASEIPTLMFTVNEMETAGLDQLNEMSSRLKNNCPGLQIVDCLCSHGFVIETIENHVKTYGVDLVVMGLQGDQFLTEKLIGSTSSALIKETKIPVLVVHHELKFKPIKKILLATDYKTLKDHKILEPLKKLAKQFSAQIYILNVTVGNYKIVDEEEAIEGITLDHYFEGIDHNFYEVKAFDVLTGVNAFADRKQIDLTVAINREHSFFESLFTTNQVKSMVFHAHTPLLTLHE